MRTFTVSQIQKILQISRQSLYELIRTGQLAGFRVGSRWRVSEEALLAFMKGGKN